MWHAAYMVKRDLLHGLRTEGSHVQPRYIASGCLVLFPLLFSAMVKSFSKLGCSSGTNAAPRACFANSLTLLHAKRHPGQPTALMLPRQTGGGSCPRWLLGSRGHLFGSKDRLETSCAAARFTRCLTPTPANCALFLL